VNTDEKTGQVRIQLDTGRCLAYGTCVSIHPEVFALPKGARVAVLQREVADASELDDLEEAVRSCPARAISIGMVA
jgi:ferredoxin